MGYQNGGDARFTRTPEIIQKGYEAPPPPPVPRPARQFDWNDADAQRAYGWPNSRIENLAPGNSWTGLERSGYHDTTEGFRPVETHEQAVVGIVFLALVFGGMALSALLGIVDLVPFLLIVVYPVWFAWYVLRVIRRRHGRGARYYLVLIGFAAVVAVVLKDNVGYVGGAVPWLTATGERVWFGISDWLAAALEFLQGGVR